jgi:hypothetical protein
MTVALGLFDLALMVWALSFCLGVPGSGGAR